MCGRYFQYGTKQEIAEFVRAQRITSETLAPDYNASPTTRQPILRVDRDTGVRELVLMDWSKQKYFPAYATINARGERLLESTMWKTFMRKGQRCCAVMSGFYEFPVVEMLSDEPPPAAIFPPSDDVAPALFDFKFPPEPPKKRKKPKPVKEARAFALQGQDLFLAGALWDTLKLPNGEIIEWFTVITTDPNELVEDDHDRMPWIIPPIPPDDLELWLDPHFGRGEGEAERLAALVRTYPAEQMRSFRANPLVKDPKNNGPDMLKLLPDDTDDRT
jgi:putative SOS response-associated peptidase YedK